MSLSVVASTCTINGILHSPVARARVTIEVQWTTFNLRVLPSRYRLQTTEPECEGRAPS